ncbi:hypothetical protein [Lacticaseibacillus brantae]|uniref:Uncharacterized protein n=1 Tax=Lacticaseibacillus brantae DSM 23927 TaxID=1423727 RepID=A0A0R2B973_9LACO|nr:hypothetical protein [Lacticaseibacillus brantae]KRM73067.1 hypothetical protein FC34_GL000788 [Lacticaseibacillus brantae DSM 23927]
MIVINSALKQDEIKDLLTNYSQDDVTFTFNKKVGIKLYFETSMADKEAAAALAKQLIKATPWGGVIFFSTVVA